MAVNENLINLIIGGGIDGLMTAFMLLKQNPGASIKLITKNSDPREIAKDSLGIYKEGDNQQLAGSTFKGLHNRFGTHFEGHNYTQDSDMYPMMDFMFRNLITEGGWLGKDIKDCNEAEIEWLARRITACCKKNEKFNNDLFELYSKYNKFALNQWKEIRENHPELFDGTDFKLGVARVYDNKNLFLAAKSLHENQNALAKEDGALAADYPEDLEKIKVKYPHFFSAIETGAIKGGVLLMDEELTFTFNIQKFCENLLNYLEENGVEMQFDTSVKSLVMNNSGAMEHLIVHSSGEDEELKIAAKNIIISTGAYAGNLLENTAAENEINGVAGGWLIMPAPAGIKQSFKVHGDRYYVTTDGQMQRYNDLSEEQQSKMPFGSLRFVADQNHMVIQRDGKEYVVIGGGYAWVGNGHDSISPQQKQAMQNENVRLGKTIYGEHYSRMEECGKIKHIDNICVRSFTTNDVPLFSIGETSSGGVFVISGGMNTGTTTAAPTTGDIIGHIIRRGKRGLNSHANSMIAANDSYEYKTDEFLKNILELNNRWKNFISEGEGKKILDANRDIFSQMVAGFRGEFGYNGRKISKSA